MRTVLKARPKTKCTNRDDGCDYDACDVIRYGTSCHTPSPNLMGDDELVLVHGYVWEGE